MLHWPIRQDIELRLPEERDAEELLAVINRNRERLEAWMHWPHLTHTTDDLLDFVHRARREFQKPDSLQFLIWRRGSVIGSCGLMLNGLDSYGEIGYWIDFEFSGQGIVTDCCRALIEYGFGELGLNRIQIRCAVGNQRSAAVAERLGFINEGRLRESFRINAGLHDQLYFGLLRSDRQ